MTEKDIEQLRAWADEYHRASFIVSDPVQFPHRYTQVEDIEICGLLTALLSFGNRKQILKKVNDWMKGWDRPPLKLSFCRKGQWEKDLPGRRLGASFYRMVSVLGLREYWEKLYEVYRHHTTLGDWLMRYPGIPMQRLCAFLGVSDRSPQKKLNMFLRWMVRRDSEVDFGIWRQMDPAELIIPLDTHVCRMAWQLGLIERPVFSLAAAKRITQVLSEIFPGDPCLGDFALFGYGVNHPALEEK